MSREKALKQELKILSRGCVVNPNPLTLEIEAELEGIHIERERILRLIKKRKQQLESIKNKDDSIIYAICEYIELIEKLKKP